MGIGQLIWLATDLVNVKAQRKNDSSQTEQNHWQRIKNSFILLLFNSNRIKLTGRESNPSGIWYNITIPIAAGQ